MLGGHPKTDLQRKKHTPKHLEDQQLLHNVKKETFVQTKSGRTGKVLAEAEDEYEKVAFIQYEDNGQKEFRNDKSYVALPKDDNLGLVHTTSGREAKLITEAEDGFEKVAVLEYLETGQKDLRTAKSYFTLEDFENEASSLKPIEVKTQPHMDELTAQASLRITSETEYLHLALTDGISPRLMVYEDTVTYVSKSKTQPLLDHNPHFHTMIERLCTILTPLTPAQKTTVASVHPSLDTIISMCQRHPITVNLLLQLYTLPNGYEDVETVTTLYNSISTFLQNQSNENINITKRIIHDGNSQNIAKLERKRSTLRSLGSLRMSTKRSSGCSSIKTASALNTLRGVNALSQRVSTTTIDLQNQFHLYCDLLAHKFKTIHDDDIAELLVHPAMRMLEHFASDRKISVSLIINYFTLPNGHEDIDTIAMLIDQMDSLDMIRTHTEKRKLEAIRLQSAEEVGRSIDLEQMDMVLPAVISETAAITSSDTFVEEEPIVASPPTTAIRHIVTPRTKEINDLEFTMYCELLVSKFNQLHDHDARALLHHPSMSMLEHFSTNGQVSLNIVLQYFTLPSGAFDTNTVCMLVDQMDDLHLTRIQSDDMKEVETPTELTVGNSTDGMYLLDSEKRSLKPLSSEKRLANTSMREAAARQQPQIARKRSLYIKKHELTARGPKRFQSEQFVE